MKHITLNRFSLFQAILLHVGLLICLLMPASIVKLQTLPPDKGEIAAYIQARAVGSGIDLPQQKGVMPAGKIFTQKNFPSAEVKGFTQTTTEQIAPQDIQILMQALSVVIQQHVVYPEAAQANAEQGKAMISFTLEPNGDIHSIVLGHSSGVVVLDEAAIQAVQSSSPIAMPIQLHAAIRLSVPVNFSLQ